MFEKAVDDYLEFLVHNFFNNLIILKETSYFDDEMETIYTLGYNLFTYGKYEKAREIFTILTAKAPYTSHYWRALGAIYQQLQKYDDAIKAYDMAIENDEYDIVSYVYRGETKILSGNVKDALIDFKSVIKIGNLGIQYDPWTKRVKLLLNIHGKSK